MVMMLISAEGEPVKQIKCSVLALPLQPPLRNHREPRQSSGFLRRPQNLKQSSIWFDIYLVHVKSSWRLFQIFVAFSECPNFNSKNWARQINVNEKKWKIDLTNILPRNLSNKETNCDWKKVSYENWALSIKDEIFVKLFLKVFINWGQSCRHF